MILYYKDNSLIETGVLINKMQLKIEDKNHNSLFKPLQEFNILKDTTKNYRKQKKIKDWGVKERRFVSHEKTIVLLIRFSALFFCLSFWYVIYRLIRAIFYA
jgi:hypothetical protein